MQGLSPYEFYNYDVGYVTPRLFLSNFENQWNRWHIYNGEPSLYSPLRVDSHDVPDTPDHHWRIYVVTYRSIFGNADTYNFDTFRTWFLVCDGEYVISPLELDWCQFQYRDTIENFHHNGLKAPSAAVSGNWGIATPMSEWVGIDVQMRGDIYRFIREYREAEELFYQLINVEVVNTEVVA